MATHIQLKDAEIFLIEVEVIKTFDINVYFLELYNKKIMDFTSSLDMEVDIHYVGQNNFEMRLYDHQGIEI